MEIIKPTEPTGKTTDYNCSLCGKPLYYEDGKWTHSSFMCINLHEDCIKPYFATQPIPRAAVQAVIEELMGLQKKQTDDLKHITPDTLSEGYALGTHSTCVFVRGLLTALLNQEPHR